MNEEAGKLLLEHYDDYCKRAQMMTEIHACGAKENKKDACESLTPGTSKGASINLSTNENTLPPAKKQKTKNGPSKDKKKTLKRL